MPPPQAHARAILGGIFPHGKAGGSAGRSAATVVSRMERRIRSGKSGIVGLSDPTGHYEAVLFAEGLAQYRDLLEPGTAVLLFFRPSCRVTKFGAHSVSGAAGTGRRQAAKRPARFPARWRPLENVARRLDAKGDGEVSMVLMLDSDTEVE